VIEEIIQEKEEDPELQDHKKVLEVIQEDTIKKDE